MVAKFGDFNGICSICHYALAYLHIWSYANTFYKRKNETVDTQHIEPLPQYVSSNKQDFIYACSLV